MSTTTRSKVCQIVYFFTDCVVVSVPVGRSTWLGGIRDVLCPRSMLYVSISIDVDEM